MDAGDHGMSTLAPPRSAKPPVRSESTTLAVPPDVRLGVSHADFEELCRNNPDLRLERTVEEELIVMAPAGTDSGGRNARLTQRLGNWSDADGTGKFFDSSTGYRLPDGATRSPDASWIRQDRWNTPSRPWKSPRPSRARMYCRGSCRTSGVSCSTERNGFRMVPPPHHLDQSEKAANQEITV